jgi:hypothetical protein
MINRMVEVVVTYSMGLDIAFHELAGARIHRNLTRTVDEAIGNDSLAVDAWQWFRSIVRQDSLFGGHGVWRLGRGWFCSVCSNSDMVKFRLMGLCWSV